MGFIESAIDEVENAIGKSGADKEISLDTAFELPLFYSFTHSEIKTLGDLKTALSNLNAEKLGSTSVLYYFEALAAVNSLEGNSSFVSDDVIRSLGAPLVDGRLSGVAVVFGDGDFSFVIPELQEKGLLVFVVGPVEDALKERGIEFGLERNLIFLGKEYYNLANAVNVALRVGLIFGNVERGEEEKLADYLVNKLPLVFYHKGDANEELTTFADVCHNLGLVLVSDNDSLKEKAAIVKDESFVQAALDSRGIKSSNVKLDIPVSYSLAFEGEKVRKPDVFVEAGGQNAKAFELCVSKSLDEIKDGEVVLVGSDVDAMQEGSFFPLGVFVEVGGKNMIKDFEPVIERRFHEFINRAEGIWHVGQRNYVWFRVSKKAKDKGFLLKHLGEILRARILSDFGGIVDKVQVTIITDTAEFDNKLNYAFEVYKKRDERVKAMTDESVDEFYTCTLCQSFAANHICIVTPQRPGLCGGVNWLDAKAAHQINSKGANQPVQKGSCDDEKYGVWKNVDNTVSDLTHKKVSNFCMYSLMRDPCTSCGCFECIVAVLPECNGVMIVDRDFDGNTPIGKTFTNLAGSVGGGVQAPGFIGSSKLYITSPKFMLAEGGIKRIVWMPKQLKEFLKDKIDYGLLGIENNFLDLVADETIVTDINELVEYLKKNNHPALPMEDILNFG